MSQFVETNVRTFSASGALEMYRRVTTVSSLAYAGAYDAGVGTLVNETFASGDKVGVRLFTANGTQKMVAADAITAGSPVYAAASGKVNDVGFVKVGIALEAASADGDVIEVLVELCDTLHVSAPSIAAAGSAQGDATAVTHRMTTVSAADGTKGVILPTPTKAGLKVLVYNEHASNGLKVYPHSGGDINDGTSNAAITIEGKTAAEFVNLDNTTWACQFTANT